GQRKWQKAPPAELTLSNTRPVTARVGTQVSGAIRAFPAFVLTHVLSPSDDALLREERALLRRLRTSLTRIDAAADQLEALDQSIDQLDELFLLVVVGEFNAGKSAFINAMIGKEVMEEGVTPTTAVITVLEYGENTEQLMRQAGLRVVKAPVEILREIRIVDTPGTNAIIREHETMTS